jgi:hypothetical protein
VPVSSGGRALSIHDGGRDVSVKHGGRVFVTADCHACPEVLRAGCAALRTRYGKSRKGVDRVVFAGDFLDRGTLEGARECLAMIESCADEVLWGNHDLAILIGYEIGAQDPRSYELQPELRARFLRGAAGDGPEWKLVTVAGDVLISHAGVSDEYARDLAECDGDLEELARRVNEEFHRAVEIELAGGPWEDQRTRVSTSPAHYKLEKHGLMRLLRGVAQVVGHTPPEKLARGYGVHASVQLAPTAVSGSAFAEDGLYLIDPGVQWQLPSDAVSPAVRREPPVPPGGLFRCAAIDSATAGVEVLESAGGTAEGAS